MLCSTLLLAALALSGSLALPQQQGGSTVSIPGVELSPAAQTSCVQLCSQKVANENPVDMNICTERRGQTPASCLCSEAKLNAAMQSCFALQCSPLVTHCAGVLGGTSFIAGGPGTQDTTGPGTPAAGTSAGGAGKPPVAPFSDINVPAAQQVACVRQCTDDVARANGASLNTCEGRLGPGNIPKCICTDNVLGTAMRQCLAARCPPLAAQGRCAAIVQDGQSFVSSGSGAVVNTGGSASSGASGSSGTTGGTGTAASPGSGNGPPGSPAGSGSGANSAGVHMLSRERAMMGVVALTLLLV